MSIFHFQYLGQMGWEPIGAGLGEGDQAVLMALEELREMAGGELPTGSYRVIAARASDPRWETFDLDPDGGASLAQDRVSYTAAAPTATEDRFRFR